MSSKIVTKRYIFTVKATGHRAQMLEQALELAKQVIAAIIGREVTYKEIDL